MYKLSEDYEYKICNDTEDYIIDSEVPVKVVIENNKVIAYLDIDGTIFNFGKVIIMEDESYAIDFYRFSKNENDKKEKNILYGKNKSKTLFDLHNHEMLFFHKFVRNKENLELLNNNKKCITKWKLVIDMDNQFNVSIINEEDKIVLGYIYNREIYGFASYFFYSEFSDKDIYNVFAKMEKVLNIDLGIYKDMYVSKIVAEKFNR